MRTIKDILSECRAVAVVGVSSNPERASYRVAAYLKSSGYRVIPVNPKETEILGERVYANLSSITEPVDVVDIFRRAEEVSPVVEEAIRIGAGTVWMQLGIVNQEAAAKARQAGLSVVMDRCMMRDHIALFPQVAQPEA
ncbi:MAG: CoA-binding protein [Chloroflexi bacterium]|nr:CoA-binding protein [Chloroflexota bacterium]